MGTAGSASATRSSCRPSRRWAPARASAPAWTWPPATRAGTNWCRTWTWLPSPTGPRWAIAAPRATAWWPGTSTALPAALDGNGHTLRNLTINLPEAGGVGMFGTLAKTGRGAQPGPGERQGHRPGRHGRTGGRQLRLRGGLQGQRDGRRPAGHGRAWSAATRARWSTARCAARSPGRQPSAAWPAT